MADNTIGTVNDNEVSNTYAGMEPTAFTRALQAAFIKGGDIRLTRPGRYLMNNPDNAFACAFIQRNTSFYIGQGVEIFMVDGSNAAMFANVNAVDPGIVVGPTAVTASGYVTTVTFAGIGAKFAVGRFFCIGNTKTYGYRGVYRVRTSDGANVITAVNWGGINTSPAVNEDRANVKAGSVTIYAVDENIWIGGPGILTYNKAGNPTYNNGNPRSAAIALRNHADCTVDGINLETAGSWAVHSNNGARSRFYRLNGDIDPTISACSPLQLTGQHQVVDVEGIVGIRSGDNVFAVSLDANQPWSEFNPGDCWNLTARNLTGIECGSAPLTALWGNANFFFYGAIIDGIHGSGQSSAFQMQVYAPTFMQNCSGTTLEIKNVDGNWNASPVVLAHNGNWDMITVDNVRSGNGGALGAYAAPNVIVGSASVASVGTTKKLILRRLTHGSTGASKGGPMVDIAPLSGTLNIGSLDIEDMQGINFAANINDIQVNAFANIGQVNLTRINNTHDSGTGSMFAANGASPIGQVNVEKSSYTGTGNTGTLIKLAATHAVSAIDFDSSRAINAAGFLSNASATVPSITGLIGGMQIVNNNVSATVNFAVTPNLTGHLAMTGTSVSPVTFNLPAVAQVVQGYEVTITSVPAIAAVTLASAGGTFAGTAVTALVANQTVKYKLVGTVWTPN